MELVPWRRRGELSAFQREMDDFWRRFFGEGRWSLASRPEWMPEIDVSETNGKVIVNAELPGLDPKDIDVSISGDVLTIRGQKKGEEENKDDNYYCRERYSGEFQRVITLPASVKSDEVEATYKNGVLKIDMKKTQKAVKKKIKVKA